MQMRQSWTAAEAGEWLGWVMDQAPGPPIGPNAIVTLTLTLQSFAPQSFKSRAAERTEHR
jgi:hypothetical protein